MKKYNFCNQCGRALQYENDILREDILAVKKDWGFFSKKRSSGAFFCIVRRML